MPCSRRRSSSTQSVRSRLNDTALQPRSRCASKMSRIGWRTSSEHLPACVHVEGADLAALVPIDAVLEVDARADVVGNNGQPLADAWGAVTAGDVDHPVLLAEPRDF